MTHKTRISRLPAGNTLGHLLGWLAVAAASALLAAAVLAPALGLPDFVALSGGI